MLAQYCNRACPCFIALCVQGSTPILTYGALLVGQKMLQNGLQHVAHCTLCLQPTMSAVSAVASKAFVPAVLYASHISGLQGIPLSDQRAAPCTDKGPSMPGYG